MVKKKINIIQKFKKDLFQADSIFYFSFITRLTAVTCKWLGLKNQYQNWKVILLGQIQLLLTNNSGGWEDLPI